MAKPIKDFNGIAKGCLIVGGLFGLMALNGMFGEDPAVKFQELKASGVTLPFEFPTTLFEHWRLINGLQLILYGLIVLVGWGLLKKKSWSVTGLKVAAWLFLAQTVLSTAWLLWSLKTPAGAEAPLNALVRHVAMSFTVVIPAVTSAAVLLMLWRLRGARLEPAALRSREG